MEILINILKLIVAFTLINVWLFRFNQPTAYRGCNSKNMIEEFAEYGLSKWMLYLVGSMKILIAVLIIYSIFNEDILFYISSILAVLMIGAIFMHMRIKDPIYKSIPALSILLIITIFILL